MVYSVYGDDVELFRTVAQAEARTYKGTAIVSILSTGRVYQFDSASTATRDGIRILTPAGGGRLLAVKTGSDDVLIPVIGTPEHQSLTQSLQVGISAGACNGNFVSDAGGGAINIASGEGMIRAVNSSNSPIFAFQWAAINGVTIPANSVRYVGVEYNNGSPLAVVRTANNFNGQTDFQAATVINEDGTLHILNNPQEACDVGQKLFHRLIETSPFQYAERLGGGIFSEIGTRNLALSPCEFYDGCNEFKITAKDTSATDTFDAYYGSFTKVANQTQWDNLNYDNGGVLTALSANRYGVHWLYIELDDHIALVYGQGNYTTITAAEAARPPASLPSRLSLHARLVAKLIFQQGNATAIEIESALAVQFQSGNPVSHNGLSNILGNGFHHLSEAERDAAIRIATASQPGIMSAAQAEVVSAITTDGSGNVGVGDPTIAARLHVKSSGSTSATFSQKIENSASSNLFSVRDDGQLSGLHIRTNFGNSVFLGEGAGLNDDGSNNRNVGVGIDALRNNTTGINITANGFNSLFSNTTGFNITANGVNSLFSNTIGNQSTANGFNSGRYIADGTTANQTSSNSVYIGANTKALADGGTNENVFGYNTTGHGSNTTTIGDSNITDTYIAGGLHVKSAGSGSTTTTFKLNNSSDTESLSVRDDGLFSTSGGRIIGYDTFTADATLTQSTKSCAVINPSAAGTVITMHLSPLDGIVQTAVNASAFTVTLGRNSEKMDGAEANYTLPANTSITWQYFGTTLGWLIISKG